MVKPKMILLATLTFLVILKSGEGSSHHSFSKHLDSVKMQNHSEGHSNHPKKGGKHEAGNHEAVSTRSPESPTADSGTFDKSISTGHVASYNSTEAMKNVDDFQKVFVDALKKVDSKNLLKKVGTLLEFAGPAASVLSIALAFIPEDVGYFHPTWFET